ncbi:hypothetical protein Emed_001925 [Eimeria media]
MEAVNAMAATADALVAAPAALLAAVPLDAAAALVGAPAAVVASAASLVATSALRVTIFLAVGLVAAAALAAAAATVAGISSYCPWMFLFLCLGYSNRPKTVSTLCVALALIFVAAQIMSGQQSTRRQRLTWGSLAALFIFLVFGTLQLPDGLLVRPSPIFWRFVKSCSIDLKDIRSWIHSLDPEAGVPLEERNYAEKCSSWESFLLHVHHKHTPHIHSTAAAAALAFAAAVAAVAAASGLASGVLGEEVAQLPRSEWCWECLLLLLLLRPIGCCCCLARLFGCSVRADTPGGHFLILDIFGCNLLGIMLGQYLCRRFQMLHYDWHAKYTKPLLALGGSATKSFSFRYSGSGVWTPPATDTTQDQTPAAAASSSPLPTSPAGSIHRMQETVSPSQQQQQQQEQQQQQLHERRKTSPVVSVKDALKTFMPYELVFVVAAAAVHVVLLLLLLLLLLHFPLHLPLVAFLSCASRCNCL